MAIYTHLKKIHKEEIKMAGKTVSDCGGYKMPPLMKPKKSTTSKNTAAKKKTSKPKK